MPGIVLMAVFLGSVEYVARGGAALALVRGSTASPPSPRSPCVAGVLFFWRVLTYRRPIVDLWAFRDRNFAFGCLLSFILGIGLYGSVYLLPLFLAQVRGYNSLQIGLVMIVTGACQFISAPIVGHPVEEARPPRHAGDRPRALRQRRLAQPLRHIRLGLLGAGAAAGACAASR